MDRVFASGASGAPPAAPGNPSSGYATAGNPGTGTPATKPGPYWYHMITEEIRKVIADAGLTPDHTNVAQLSQAVQVLAGNLAKVHGQCRLAKSGANLVLSPYNGNKLMINGAVQAVPAAGVTLAPTGLSATTLYYIYAYMNSGTMTLEASTTGHSTDATTGVEIKTGDATRTLVGMAYCKTAATFADTDSQRLVASWFNRVSRRIFNNFTVSRSTASTTPIEINSEIRCEFICWADESAKANFFGEFYTTGAGIYMNAGLGWDGASVDGYVQATSSGTSPLPFTAPGNRTPGEGYHYATGIGNTASSTTTYGSLSGAVCSINGMIG